MNFEVGKIYKRVVYGGCGYDAWTNVIEYRIVKKNDTTIWYSHGLDEDEYGEYFDKVHRAKLDRSSDGNECFRLIITRPGVYLIDGSRLKDKSEYWANAYYDNK